MSPLPTHFAAVLAGLQAAIAAHAARERAFAPLLLLVWNYLARASTRFGRLVARWQAGRPAKPRPSRAGRPARPRPRIRLPAARGWLLRRALPAAAFAGQFQAVLARPDLADLLRDVPQAGRILRPLWRMLSPDPVPPALTLPPRPRRPRRPRPRPAAPPGGTPDRPLPAYVRAAVRAWRPQSG